MYKSFLGFIFYFYSVTVLAQSKGAIQGKVLDNAAPIEFATVSIFNQKDTQKVVKYTATDSIGHFLLNDIPFNDYILKIQMIGYLPYTVQISLEQPQQILDLGNIFLSIDPKLLKTVEISARKSLIQKTAQGLIINASSALTSEGGTATDLLRSTPTVAVDAEGVITLRGKTPMIMVNGRNFNLSSTDQIPANSIESIEIINNPSAKYDADADAGIINIRLKKSTKSGTNGAFGLGTGYGAKGRLNSSFLLNHTVKKWNIGVAYDNRFAGRTRQAKGDRVNFNIPPQYFLTQRRFDERIERIQNLRFNLNYAINSKNSIALETIGNIGGEDNDETLNNLIETQNRNFTNKYSRRSLEYAKEKGAEFTLIYKRKFDNDKQRFSINVSSAFNKNKENTDINNQTYSENGSVLGSPFLQRTNYFLNTNVTILQTDYAIPISEKGMIEMGYKGIIRVLNADFKSQDKINDAYITKAQTSDVFNFDENIHAVYALFKSSFNKKIKYEFGLRAEQVWNNGKSESTQTVFDNRYLKPFPSASMVYDLKENTFLKANYSRRINRPRLGQLNPFTDITDSLTQRSGNPKLLPELIHVLELGYNKDWEKASLTANLFYRYTENSIQNFTVLRPDGVLYTQPKNIGSATTYGLENIATIQVNKYWDTNLSLTVFQQNLNGANISTEAVNSIFSWYAKIINNFSVWKGAKGQIVGIYNAPIATPQGTRIAIYNVDASFQQKILKDKGRLGLIVTDIFNTQRNGFLWNTPDFTFSRIFKVDTRAILINFAYTFGTSFKEKLMENKFSND